MDAFYGSDGAALGQGCLRHSALVMAGMLAAEMMGGMQYNRIWSYDHVVCPYMVIRALHGQGRDACGTVPWSRGGAWTCRECRHETIRGYAY